MDAIIDFLFSRSEHLLGRFSGPLNFRLVVMPTVVTVLAVLADRRDAREGRRAVLGAFIKDPVERQRLFRSALKDIGRVFMVAILLDTTYQLLVFKWVYPGEVLVVAVVFNWRNSVPDYWLNLLTASVTDVGFLLFIVKPGYLPLRPALLGPALWLLATIFSTWGVLSLAA